MNVFKMAWRNVLRNKRRAGITVAAMSLALWTMILYSGLVTGYVLSMERNILDLEMGDIQIAPDGYRDKPSIYKRIENQQQLVADLNNAGYMATPRLLGSGLAAAGDSSAGVTFRGVDPKLDAKVSFINKHVQEGKWLSEDDPHEVVIGRRLARILAVKPGDEIVALTQGADGSMANELYKVRGILKGISDGVDRGGIFMLVRDLRELLVIETGVHQIIIRKPTKVLIGDATARVASIAKEHDVKSWRQLTPTLANMLDTSRSAMFVMFMIIYIAIAIVILNAMLMAVFERIREFGVLKAIGVGPVTVMKLIFVESFIQTMMAVFIGTVASLPMLSYLANTGINMGKMGGVSVVGITMDPYWRAVIDSSTFSSPIIVLVVVVMLAVIYPALKAARLHPVDAIHHQ